MRKIIWGRLVLRSVIRGIFWAALIILIVLFSTGVESKFIYTDF